MQQKLHQQKQHIFGIDKKVTFSMTMDGFFLSFRLLFRYSDPVLNFYAICLHYHRNRAIF